MTKQYKNTRDGEFPPRFLIAMNRNYLAKIEERLAILEEICDNSDSILNETERNFIKEEIEEQIRK